MSERKEKLVASYLRQNSRMKLTKMAKLAGVPVSTLHERMKRGDFGFIERYTCLLDFSAFGYTTKAEIVLQSNLSHKQALLEFLMRHHSVNSLYKINNGYDYLVECIFRNLQEMEAFLENLHSKFRIKRQEVYYIIEELRREAFMSDPQLVGVLL